MRDERRTRRDGPLPIGARQVLWRRLWDKLLASPVDPSEGSEALPDGTEDRPDGPRVGGGRG